jgi:small subunit ribosomal protein S9
MAETTNRIYATGKRKTAVARVWLLPGSGQVKVNHRPADDYFVRETNRMVMRQSLELLELNDQYDVFATVVGGGHSAQAEAMRHGIARALIAADPERRASLKRAGFLTRDARKKERKKYGQPGARKRFQYSKR